MHQQKNHNIEIAVPFGLAMTTQQRIPLLPVYPSLRLPMNYELSTIYLYILRLTDNRVSDPFS